MTHVALVDDDPHLLQYLTDLLSDRGYTVDAFDRTRAAWDALSQDSPDLVVCDVELPDGSGLDLVARLRANHGEALPVLMLSGLSREDDFMRGFAAGATDYLTKPITAAELLAKVAVLLSRTGAAAAEVPGGDALPGGAGAAFGRYRIEALVGQGSYGIVYRAHDLTGRREVALKVLGHLASSQPETRMRFLRETYALGSLRHPHVVRVHDFGAAEGRLYYAMDLVRGPSIEARTRQATATETDAAVLLRGLALGLAALEGAGLVHRDMKPANVILQDGDWGRPLIVDFGLAKHPFDRGLTDAEMLIGTPGYMAPETILGRPIDGRTDLFAVGLIVRFALTGEEAFPGLAALSLLEAMTTRPVPVPPLRSSGLRAVLKSLLQVDPDRRPASATALLRTLDVAPTGEAAR